MAGKKVDMKQRFVEMQKIVKVIKVEKPGIKHIDAVKEAWKRMKAK